jgi:hypothetical protein
VTIWVVRVGDDLYVRSWKGDHSAWFRSTQDRQAGHIKAGGVGKDVAFVTEADHLNDQIDAACRTKYRRRRTLRRPDGGTYGSSYDDQARAASYAALAVADAGFAWRASEVAQGAVGAPAW